MGLESFQALKGDTNPLDILKDLFDNTNIYMKSEVSDRQFRAMVRLKWLEEIGKQENKKLSGLTILNDKVIPYALELMVSRNRLSRKEAEKILSAIGGALLQNDSNLAKDIKKG